MYDPNAIKIYIDGSALKNPGGPGGIAGISVYPEELNRDKEIIFKRGFKQTTNNRMELRACIEALQWVRHKAPRFRIPRKMIITDSVYVNTCWKNCLFWQHNGWVSYDGLPIENYRLIRELISARRNSGTGVELKWQHGKTDEFTLEVDRIAKSMSKSSPENLDDGFTHTKVSPAKVPGGRATVPCFTGIVEVARIYKKETHFKTGLVKVSFEIYSRLENKYTEKRHAYVNKNFVEDLNRQHHYKLIIEGERRVPMIESYNELTIVT